ncbi:MAG: hypothetical protein R3B92_02365 [Patescibacteria group bacterium]
MNEPASSDLNGNLPVFTRKWKSIVLFTLVVAIILFLLYFCSLFRVCPGFSGNTQGLDFKGLTLENPKVVAGITLDAAALKALAAQVGLNGDVIGSLDSNQLRDGVVTSDKLSSTLNYGGTLNLAGKWMINGVEVKATAEDLNKLLSQSSVIVNRPVTPAPAVTNPTVSTTNVDLSSYMTKPQIESLINSIVDAKALKKIGSTQGIFAQADNGELNLEVKAGKGLRQEDEGLTLRLLTSATGSATSSVSGLELTSSGVSLLGGCSSSQILVWNGSVWACADQGSGSGDITAVGSMTSGDVFANSTADDDWLGLGASAGRIEFDDQTTDEVNILNARVGIGTQTPSVELDVVGDALFGNQQGTGYDSKPSNLFINELVTDGSTGNIAMHSFLDLDIASDSSSVFLAGYSNAHVASTDAQNYTGSLRGMQGQTDHYGTGTVSSGRGIVGLTAVRAAGTITNAYGGFFGNYNLHASGTITNSYNLYVVDGSDTGTTTNNYGLYIENMNNGDALNYAIYSAGGISYFAGNVGIGTTNPTSPLTVSGTIRITDKAHNSTSLSIPADFTAWHIGTDEDGYMAFGHSGSENIFRIGFGGGAHLRSGSMGIGTTSPAYKLDVLQDSASFVARFFNDGNAATRQGVLVQGCADTNPSASCNFIEFRDGDGTAVGAVEGNGAGGVSLNTSGADYAELFEGDRTKVSPGDLLAVDSSGKIVKATPFKTLVGAYSTSPSVVGNWQDGWENNNSLIPVGLLGRMRVSFKDTNGQIEVGDPVAVSLTDAGKAVRANTSGRILGYALENQKDDGELLVYVSPTWYAPIQEESPVLASVSTSSEGIQALDTLSASFSDLQEQVTEFMDSINIHFVKDGDVETLVFESPVKFASGLEVKDLLSIGDLTFDSANNSINTDTKSCDTTKDCEDNTLYLQKTLAGNVNILDGVMLITKDGDVYVDGTLTVDKLAFSDNEDSQATGTAKIKEGADSVTVKTKALTKDSIIFLTPVNKEVAVTYEIKEDNEFEIKVSDLTEKDLRVNWWVVN